MTAARKLVLVICSLAVVAACLWVPWRERPHGTYSIDRGYALLWEPPERLTIPVSPSQKWMAVALYSN